jgi:hypothetical protein
VQEATIEALSRSKGMLANTASRVEVRVAARAQSHWQGTPPELTVEDAALLLALPLRLVVEDRFSDRHFLTCVAPEPRRKALRRAFEKGWFRTEHGGGLGNMGKYIDSLEEEPAEKLRTWLLFDRDVANSAQPSEEPSKESKALKQKCEDAQLPHHRLGRRSIENYLPPRALYAWSGLVRGHPSTQRSRLVQQFEAMPAEQRHVLDMKERFGERIAELFREEAFNIDPMWLTQDGQRPEIDAIMQGIFERM